MNSKRKFPINNSNKLKKISLNVFDNDDDDDNNYNKNSLNDVVMNNNSNGGNIIASIGSNNAFIKSNVGVVNESSSSSTTTTSISLSSSSTSAFLSSSSSESQLKQEQRDIITKTATWVINNNKDNISILLERSKDNPVLSFLFDGNNTIAGKYYMKELNRLQVEKHVQSVCSGLPVPVINSIPSAVIPSPLSASSSSSSSSSLIATTSTATSSSLIASSSTNSNTNEKRNRWGPISDYSNSAHTTTATSSIEGGSRVSSSSSSYHDYSYSSSIAKNSNNKNDDFNGHYSDDDNDGNQIEHDQRMEKLLREQKELQLLESRIRDAAKQNLYGSSSSSSSSNITEVAKYISKQSKNGNSTNNDNNRIGKSNVEIHIAEQQAELYLERLTEYESLAQLDDDNYRDTVDEAERNGGVIEGGTWEHRKRAKEMLKTAAKNLELTLMGSGKHHMADYLPPDILNQFLKNAEAVSKGESSTSLNKDKADDKKITDSNIGYQLLSKSGWIEGSGLGATGSGIIQPLSATGSSNSNKVGGTNATSSSSSSSNSSNSSSSNVLNRPSVEGSGIGVHATHEVQANDNEFDQYRKRMMLAYRFRPNPLNNPRRDYY